MPVILRIFHILYLFRFILRKCKLILWYFTKKSITFHFLIFLCFSTLVIFVICWFSISPLLIFKDCNQESFLIYLWILCHAMDHHINFQDLLSQRKEFIIISIRWDTDVPQWGMVTFQESNLLKDLFLLHRGNFWDAPMKNESYENCLFRAFSRRMWAVAGEKSKDAMETK